MINTISVIVPVYNVEDYLSRCINSILSQEGVKIELILINDGSTDNSGNICNEFSSKYNNIIVVNQDNKGVSYARNTGIQKANGYWICFVDGDDWLEPNSLYGILEQNNNSEAELLIAKSLLNNEGIVISEKYPFSFDSTINNYNGINLFIDYGYIRGSVWGVLYKNSFLKDNNILFPLGLKNGEDAIFFTLCLIFAKKISFFKINFYNIFERNGSASRSWSIERIFKMTDNIIYLNDYLIKNPLLNRDAFNILNYSKYRVISNIFYQFADLFTINSYFLLRKEIQKSKFGKLEVGRIKFNNFNIKLLNFSIDMFALLIFLKKKFYSI